MSDALSADLVSGSIDASLAEIDTRSRDSEKSSQGDIVVGPFAVLDLTTSNPVVPRTTTGTSNAEAPSLDPLDDGSSVVSPSLSQESIAYMNDLLQWSDILSLDPQMHSAALSAPFDLGDWLPLESATQVPILERNVTGEETGQSSAVHMSVVQEGVRMMTQQTLIDPNPPDVLANAHFLLRHFQDHVISRLMAIPLDQKSPWKILNVPSAVVTYSDMTFLGSQTISHARLANLYCLLACSALHLAVDPSLGSPDSKERWRPVAEYAYHVAKDHMQMSLKNETQEPKKAKYKDQLMAICALTEYAVGSCLDCW